MDGYFSWMGNYLVVTIDEGRAKVYENVYDEGDIH